VRLTPTVAGIGASVTLTAASFVLLFGVVATAGVYGSRVAWLCGVAMPLLALTMLLARLSMVRPAWSAGHGHPPPDGRRAQVGRGLFLVALSLFGLPCVFVAAVLSVDAFLIAVHGLLLLR
jgi:hypothetical protein